MARFTELQKKMALCLLDHPLSKKALIARFERSREALEKELQPLLDAGLVEERGGRLSLRADIAQELDRRRGIQQQDANKLRLQAILEAKALDEKLLAKTLDKIERQLKKASFLKIYALSRAAIVKEEGEEGYYSSFIEVNLSVRDFSALVHFMFFFGPVSVEVIKPAQVTFDAADLQEGLMDFSEMNQKYVHYITQLMNRQELEAFYRHLME